MVVDLIGIYGLKGPYCTLTTTDWFLQALSVIPRGSWGDVARRFTMIRWASPEFRPSLSSHKPPPPPPRVAGICSGQFDEENPFVQNLSVLIVQADKGVSVLFVDRIGDIYRSLPRRADFIVTTVGARHKCQQENPDRKYRSKNPSGCPGQAQENPREQQLPPYRFPDTAACVLHARVATCCVTSMHRQGGGHCQARFRMLDNTAFGFENQSMVLSDQLVADLMTCATRRRFVKSLRHRFDLRCLKIQQLVSLRLLVVFVCSIPAGFVGNPGFTAGRGFNPAGGAPGGG
ncbi:hypothetical protein F511_20474 [Dorcoceras hygrometricum]|uniref:Uncharacterized protein n=1 Tax=Dorcoceras hygrometricum TaxID=472368 RepID=A0A2Z7BPL1_9LAMI|nr:hypothetical protein F511_20474 [Dorcoceras hygrometricum]